MPRLELFDSDTQYAQPEINAPLQSTGGQKVKELSNAITRIEQEVGQIRTSRQADVADTEALYALTEVEDEANDDNNLDRLSGDYYDKKLAEVSKVAEHIQDPIARAEYKSKLDLRIAGTKLKIDGIRYQKEFDTKKVTAINGIEANFNYAKNALIRGERELHLLDLKQYIQANSDFFTPAELAKYEERINNFPLEGFKADADYAPGIALENIDDYGLSNEQKNEATTYAAKIFKIKEAERKMQNTMQLYEVNKSILSDIDSGNINTMSQLNGRLAAIRGLDGVDSKDIEKIEEYFLNSNRIENSKNIGTFYRMLSDAKDIKSYEEYNDFLKNTYYSNAAFLTQKQRSSIEKAVSENVETVNKSKTKSDLLMDYAKKNIEKTRLSGWDLISVAIPPLGIIEMFKDVTIADKARNSLKDLMSEESFDKDVQAEVLRMTKILNSKSTKEDVLKEKENIIKGSGLTETQIQAREALNRLMLIDMYEDSMADALQAVNAGEAIDKAIKQAQNKMYETATGKIVGNPYKINGMTLIFMGMDEERGVPLFEDDPNIVKEAIKNLTVENWIP